MRRATLDHHTWQTLHHYLDSTHHVDAAARTVDITHPDRDALRYAGVPAEERANPPSNVFAILVVHRDSVDSNVGGGK
jgi:hypothetical protein